MNLIVFQECCLDLLESLRRVDKVLEPGVSLILGNDTIELFFILNEGAMNSFIKVETHYALEIYLSIMKHRTKLELDRYLTYRME
jgi:hypothetical protein